MRKQDPEMKTREEVVAGRLARCVQPGSPEAETGVEVLAFLLDQPAPVSSAVVGSALGLPSPIAGMSWLFWLSDLGLVRHNGRDLSWEPCPEVRAEWTIATTPIPVAS